MSRRTLARGLLVLVALWPLVTIVLQRTWDVDPWKLMSFGMYAVPSRRIESMQLALSVRRDGGWEPVALSAASLNALDRRRTLGKLVPLRSFARRAMDESGTDAAKAILSTSRLDAATSHVEVDYEEAAVERR